jgi:hypothetical protein
MHAEDQTIYVSALCIVTCTVRRGPISNKDFYFGQAGNHCAKRNILRLEFRSSFRLVLACDILNFVSLHMQDIYVESGKSSNSGHTLQANKCISKRRSPCTGQTFGSEVETRACMSFCYSTGRRDFHVSIPNAVRFDQNRLITKVGPPVANQGWVPDL